MPSRQDYENRLRDDARHALAPHFQNFQAELQSLRDSIASSVAQLEQKVTALETVDVSGGGGAILDALEGAARNAEQEKESLARFALNMRRCETQEEILSLLLDGVSTYAPRAALFVVRNDQFVAWASRGYSEQTAAAIASQPFPESDSPALTKALGAEDALTISDVSAESRVFALLRDEQEAPWHAFPLRALRRPVAVLLVTCAPGRTCELQPISLMMHITGLCIENVALKILQEMKASSMPEPAGPAIAAPPVPQVTAAAAAAPEPMVAAEVPPQTEEAAPEAEAVAEEVQPVEATAATQPVEEATEPHQPEQTPAASIAAEEEQVVAIAAVGEAAPTEIKAPESVTVETTPETAVAQATPVQPQGEAEPIVTAAKPMLPRETGKVSEEERLHSDAKRFARLLVSEIKLYNEQRVQEGRANRDLYVRLKRDIDRSREMYEKRVSPVVSRKMDYFHDELVRILGENDPVALGSDYSGSRVEN